MPRAAEDAPRALRFRAGERGGDVDALWWRPPGAHAALVLAHGAGAGMRHAFMEEVARALAAEGVASLRFEFPYMQKGGRRPDPRPVLLACVEAASDTARERSEGLPLFAGGKSMGGRMSSLAAAEGALPQARGLVFFGFPLHAAGRPSSDRAAHLAEVAVPMLFLQGERDRLADLAHLRPVCRGLGGRATLHVVPDADHSFRVPKRTGRTAEEVIRELAVTASEWMRKRTG